MPLWRSRMTSKITILLETTGIFSGSQGKVILVTGGNIGLGKQTILELSRHGPAQIWLASRNLEKAQVAADDIKRQIPGSRIELLELDLTSFESIRKAVTTFKSKSDRLDILMLNAGIMATLPGLTKEGYEIQFGTNHMGHAYLTKLLLPVLETTARTGDVRIVSLSSDGHTMWPQGEFHFESLKTPADSLGPYKRYFRSKLANVLWVRQMAKVYPQFTVAAIHPGVVQTNLMDSASGTPAIVRTMTRFFYGFLKTVEDGAKNQLWASVSKDVQSGEYYTPVGITGKASVDGMNDHLAKEVWDWTQRELEAHGV
ncbi:related to alcohol dehydrogenase homolog Bli-4 [Cephalotrichum gorgonifer]|uniref:Related to alcohol dehydrogenase homolog Bli-4 n=1 Tax=Cephalotrichum gorgonifer TaxID=2041049 RepID=A0AAE8N2F4_9PEZI|nr:related to alcohol dehydrogenase homolog Bli-4 [Cephalotrichum gorgonifer]